jgi:hypothetical protein
MNTCCQLIRCCQTGYHPIDREVTLWFVLKESLQENMSQGCIWLSSLLLAARVLTGKKPGWGSRVCIAYWDSNTETIKNRYSIPLIKETLNLLGIARIYTILDVRAAYNSRWIKEGNESKLTFQTRYVMYEPTVIQFGTTNATADLQGCINNAIREALDKSASV